jgi:hypothetical protein
MPKKTKQTKPMVRTLIVVSDTHCGCRLGLFNPNVPVRLDDGGFYRASELQEKMWAFWREFWDEWVPTVTKGEPYDICHNGDVIEGVHHHATTQVSHNINDQKRIALAVMLAEVERCKKSGGSYYHIRGTAAHVGQSSIFEDEVAEALGAVPNTQGQFARYDLWKRVGDAAGALVHLLHHIGTTSSAAHESSAVNAELTAEYVEAARWNREPPDFIVRSHRHRSIAVDLNSAKGYAAGIVTPAWQGKTPFAWKIPGARISEPQFGGIAIRQGDEENYYRRKVWSLDRSPVE